MTARYFIMLMCGLAFSTVSTAQTNSNDYEQILRDIITQGPNTQFPPMPNEVAQVFALKVTTDFDMHSDIVEGRLIIQAISGSTESASQVDIITEVAISLDGLVSPLSITLSIPRRVLESSEILRLRGSIEDSNGAVVFRSETTPMISDDEPAFLGLSPIINTTPPKQSNPLQGTTGIVQGTAALKQAQNLFQGSTLLVQLMSEGLAGGPASQIKGETQIEIADPEQPIAFRFSYSLNPEDKNVPLGLKASVKDWAGRITHVMPGRISFKNNDRSYRLTLDALKQGTEVTPFITEDVIIDTHASEPALRAMTSIIGRATFPAERGLPAGSKLVLKLWEPNNAGGVTDLKNTEISLDGLSGDIDFNMDAQPSNETAQLFIDGQIITQDGLALFDVTSFPARPDYTVLPLSVLPNY